MKQERNGEILNQQGWKYKNYSTKRNTEEVYED